MKLKIYVLILFFLFLSSLLLAQESLTITTYYPSPYGVYKNLRLYPTDDFSPGSSCSNAGEMYYDASDRHPYVCNGSQWQWQSLEGYWVLSGNNLYAVDPNWNVGIGATTPVGKLQVQGPDNTASVVTFMPGNDTAAAGTPELKFLIKGTQNSSCLQGKQDLPPNPGLQVIGTISRQGTTMTPVHCSPWCCYEAYSLVNLGVESPMSGYDNTIGGGYRNTLGTSSYSRNNVIRGGRENDTSASGSGGGLFSAIGGGYKNTTLNSFVGGGYLNYSYGDNDIGGGRENAIPPGSLSGFRNIIAGGYNNRIERYTYNTIAGGASNYIAGGYPGWAGGRRARSQYMRTFVWADSRDADYFDHAAPSCQGGFGCGDTFNVRAQGGAYFETSGPTPWDIAEFMEIKDSENTEEAEIVSIVENNLLGKSKKPYDDNLIGVVSSKRTTTMHLGTIAHNRLPIALAGQCYVKVNNEGGKINLGDPITSSSTPGIGMKANKSGKILGYALEKVDFKDKEIKEVLVFIGIDYINKDRFINQEEYQALSEKLETLKKKLELIKLSQKNK